LKNNSASASKPKPLSCSPLTEMMGWKNCDMT
jgi:hypothetical protein